MQSVRSEEFWKWVNRKGPVPKGNRELGRCWVWRGACNAKGQPVYLLGRRARIPHRYAWHDVHGEIPAVNLGSKCWNDMCVRPAHRAPGVAWRARMNTCGDGHPLAVGHPNTYVREDGKRQCRKCAARRVRQSTARKKLRNAA